MEVSYKFRIYPNKEQEQLIQKTFGCVRYVYNYFLAKRINVYKETGKTLSFFDQSKELTVLKQQLEWLQEPDKSSLQNALRNLDAAYKNFFRRVKNGEKPGSPKFKKISKRSCWTKSKSCGRKTMPLPKTCANCGAPLTSGKCEYCGTVYVHDRTSAQEAQLMAELQKTMLEIRISKQLAEMNASLEQQKQQQNKSLIDRLFGR